MISKVRVDDWKNTYSVQFGDPRDADVLTLSFSITCSDLDKAKELHERVVAWADFLRGLATCEPPSAETLDREERIRLLNMDGAREIEIKLPK